MTEKETLRIVLSEEQELELEFECSLKTFATVLVAAIQEMELPDDIVAVLFTEIAHRYFRWNFPTI